MLFFAHKISGLKVITNMTFKFTLAFHPSRLLSLYMGLVLTHTCPRCVSFLRRGTSPTYTPNMSGALHHHLQYSISKIILANDSSYFASIVPAIPSVMLCYCTDLNQLKSILQLSVRSLDSCGVNSSKLPICLSTSNLFEYLTLLVRPTISILLTHLQHFVSGTQCVYTSGLKPLVVEHY